MQKQQNFKYSLEIIQNIVNQIVQQSYQFKTQQQLQKMIPIHSQIYLTDILNKMFQIYQCNQQAISCPRLDIDKEANCLIMDNLMPSSLNLQIKQTEQQLKQIEERIPQSKMSSRRNTRSNAKSNLPIINESTKKKNNEDNFELIQNVPLQEEDRAIKLLRQKKSYERIIYQKQQKKKIKNIKKQIDQKKINQIAFDFDGELLRIKPITSTNLIKTVLGINIKTQQPIQIKKKLSMTSTKISIKNDPPISKKKILEQPQEINHIVNFPIEKIQLVQGTKIMTGRRTQENAKRQISLKDLKQNYKQMRLTKEDYFRLKQIQNQNREISQHKMTDIRQQFKNLKVISNDQMSKIFNSTAKNSSKNKSTSKVVVNNNQLKTIHLTNFSESSKLLNQRDSTNTKKNVQKQNPNVDHHLQFILHKNNSNINLNAQKVQVLPEIKHMNSGLMKKARQKLKNQKQILIQINKKFEDRLRSTVTITPKRI